MFMLILGFLMLIFISARASVNGTVIYRPQSRNQARSARTQTPKAQAGERVRREACVGGAATGIGTVVAGATQD